MTEKEERRLSPANLWASEDVAAWREALGCYEGTIVAQQVNRLPELDRWYREELPGLIAARTPGYVTLDDLVRVTEWKMKRGVWRQRNLLLVKSNALEDVERVSREALERAPDSTAPIVALSKLAGVGPATASAVAAAAAPDVYPFFDDLVANQVPGLGSVDFTVKFYARYAAALRDRAGRLGSGWTPVMVERALWAFAGGKAGASSKAEGPRDGE